MEGSLLLRRPDATDLSAYHRRIEVAPEYHGWREEAVAVLAVEDQAVGAARMPAAVPRGREQLDYIGDQVDVPTLAVLRRADRAAGVTATDARDSLVEIDVVPPQR